MKLCFSISRLILLQYGTLSTRFRYNIIQEFSLFSYNSVFIMHIVAGRHLNSDIFPYKNSCYWRVCIVNNFLYLMISGQCYAYSRTCRLTSMILRNMRGFSLISIQMWFFFRNSLVFLYKGYFLLHLAIRFWSGFANPISEWMIDIIYCRTFYEWNCVSSYTIYSYRLSAYPSQLIIRPFVYRKSYQQILSLKLWCSLFCKHFFIRFVSRLRNYR